MLKNADSHQEKQRKRTFTQREEKVTNFDYCITFSNIKYIYGAIHFRTFINKLFYAQSHPSETSIWERKTPRKGEGRNQVKRYPYSHPLPTAWNNHCQRFEFTHGWVPTWRLQYHASPHTAKIVDITPELQNNHFLKRRYREKKMHLLHEFHKRMFFIKSRIFPF